MLVESVESSFALSVVQKLREAGFEALWAGGCVRDLLLNIPPADYDVATSATPKQVRKLFGYSNTAAVGIVFGVVIVRDPEGSSQQIEVATFRTESSYSDGRRPDSVEFSTPEKDAQRRDFTINGMFFDPDARKVIDFVGGQADLKGELIRAIGDPCERIAEDKLRMLRAVRFAARFGFAIHTDTRSAIVANAEAVSIISGERVAIEFQKTLECNLADWAVKEWAELGLLRQILPLGNCSVEKSKIELASEALANMRDCGWLAKTSCLLRYLADATPDQAQAIVTEFKSRLKLANDDAKALRFALENYEKLCNAQSLPWSRLQPILINDAIAVAVELLQATPVNDSARQYIEEKLAVPGETLNPPAFFTGNDLLELGCKPGPLIRQILLTARALQLDDKLVSRNQALEWAKERVWEQQK